MPNEATQMTRPDGITTAGLVRWTATAGAKSGSSHLIAPLCGKRLREGGFVGRASSCGRQRWGQLQEQVTAPEGRLRQRRRGTRPVDLRSREHRPRRH
jgi:hypothetical protein